MANFHNILELNIKMQQELFHSLRNAKQINMWNFTKKIRFTKRNQKKIAKWNKILLLTKQNETKFRCLFCFAKQAKFRETIFCFVFRETKKGCEMETLVLI
jgi:hypothetical protein